MHAWRLPPSSPLAPAPPNSRPSSSSSSSSTLRASPTSDSRRTPRTERRGTRAGVLTYVVSAPYVPVLSWLRGTSAPVELHVGAGDDALLHGAYVSSINEDCAIVVLSLNRCIRIVNEVSSDKEKKKKKKTELASEQRDLRCACCHPSKSLGRCCDRRRLRQVAGSPTQHLPHAVGHPDGRVGHGSPAEGHVGSDGLLHHPLDVLPPQPAPLVLHRFGAQPAEPFAVEVGLHAADVVSGAVLTQPAALALHQLDLHCSVDDSRRERGVGGGCHGLHINGDEATESSPCCEVGI
ncbi:hypothetical protein BHM03_00011869 [Ensete ventricosum]|nr:hypothetical protein BHM03_00011869 [Ensete ventricosum]